MKSCAQQSEHASLHADYSRLKQASADQPGLIAEQELDDAQSKDLASEAQVDAAKSALSAAGKTSTSPARITSVSALSPTTPGSLAPIDGVIIWRYADTGALIQAGTASDVQSLPVVKLSAEQPAAPALARSRGRSRSTSTWVLEVKCR